MIRKEFTKYICLSKKDKEDLKNWFGKKKQKPKAKKYRNNLSVMASKLVGKPYEEFLRSKYWEIVRSKVIKRDSGRCRVCKSNYRLHVHHETYKNHFKEHLHLEDLITLCECCHKQHHYCT